jgi:predicted Co/Zn/Cd cation transporter (cation efflux family)
MTERIDLFIAIAVAVMFVAGCFLTVFSVRRRAKNRKRWDANSIK